MHILLRFVENAPVALVQSSLDSVAEQLPTRYDLYPHPGGVAWGYSGSGPTNLAFSIASKFLNPKTSDTLISEKATILLEKLIALLDGDAEHDLPFELIGELISAE